MDILFKLWEVSPDPVFTSKKEWQRIEKGAEGGKGQKPPDFFITEEERVNLETGPSNPTLLSPRWQVEDWRLTAIEDGSERVSHPAAQKWGLLKSPC